MALQTTESRWPRIAGWLFLLPAVTAIPYLNAVGNGFVWLDQSEVVNGGMLVNSWREAAEVFTKDDRGFEGYHRPLYNLAHSLDHALWGLDPRGYHASSLLIHLANTVLWYLVVVTLVGRHWCGLAIASLWGVLPVNTAAVSLIHGKADLLVSFFLLSTLYSALCLPRARTRRAIAFCLAAAYLTYVLALFSKETSLVFPLFLVYAMACCAGGHGLTGPQRKASACLVAAIFATAALHYLQRAWTGRLPSSSTAWDLTDRVMTFILVYGDYITKSMSGIVLTTNDSVTMWRHDDAFWSRAAVSAACVAAQLYAGLKIPRARPGLIWFNLFLLPVAQIHPLLHFRADRFLYLPSMGLVWTAGVAAATAYGRLPRRTSLRRAGIGLWLGVLLASGCRTWTRNADFRTDRTLFEPLVASYPWCREAQSYLAAEYTASGEYGKAERAFASALSVDPKVHSYVDYSGTLMTYAVFLLRTGRYDRAYRALGRLAGTERSTDPEYAFNRAVCAIKLKRFREAKELLVGYLSSKPTNADGLFLCGKVSALLGEYDDALSAYRRYIVCHPVADERELVERRIRAIERAKSAAAPPRP